MYARLCFATCFGAPIFAAVAACTATPTQATVAQAARTEPAGFRPSSHAIVLAHGIDASRERGFFGLDEVLRNDGHVVHVAEVSPYKSVTIRAVELTHHIDEAIAECRNVATCDASKVHVIAHSMGGLDSRFAITKLGYGSRVASLTTISTPHRGSYIADVLLKYAPGNLDSAVNAFAVWRGEQFTAKDLAENSDLRAALDSLSEKTTAETFNPTVPNDSRVAYFSWAGVSNIAGIRNPNNAEACDGSLDAWSGVGLAGFFSPGRLLASAFERFVEGDDIMTPALVPGSIIVGHGLEFRPNDGLVTVESAKWGKFRGCLPADHNDEVGQPGLPSLPNGFSAKDFYRSVAASLDDDVRDALGGR